VYAGGRPVRIAVKCGGFRRAGRSFIENAVIRGGVDSSPGSANRREPKCAWRARNCARARRVSRDCAEHAQFRPRQRRASTKRAKNARNPLRQPIQAGRDTSSRHVRLFTRLRGVGAVFAPSRACRVTAVFADDFDRFAAAGRATAAFAVADFAGAG